MKSTDPSQALAIALAKEIPPEMIAKVLAEAMVATVVFRNGAVEIDHRSRLESTKLALTLQLKPEFAAAITKTKDANPDANLAERLKRSPALRRAFRKIIEDAGD